MSEVRGSCREYQTQHRNGREELPHVQGRGVAKRRYPASEVRGGNESSYPMYEVRGRGREEIPHAPSPRPGAMGGRSYPTHLSPRPRVTAGRSNRTTEARGGGWEDQPLVQGAVAVWAQDGLEELSHIEGQEGRQ